MGVQNLYTEVIDRNKYDLVDGRCVHHLEDIPEQDADTGSCSRAVTPWGA